MSDLSDLVASAASLSWPVLVGILLIAYRKKITPFLEALSKRVTGISIGPLSLELAEARASGQSLDVDFLSSQGTHFQGFNSGSAAFLQQVIAGPTLDYVTINLEPSNWLASRLYMYASLLQRARALRCIVFTESSTDVKNRFVGFAETNSVLWALTGLHPWLEVAFATAESNSKVSSKKGASGEYAGIGFRYLRLIESRQTPSDPKEWVQLPGSQIWEHSKWLDSTNIEQLLDGHLVKSFLWKGDLEKSKAGHARLVTSMEGPFVAIVDQNKRFDSLIDRQEVVERIAKRVIAESTPK